MKLFLLFCCWKMELCVVRWEDIDLENVIWYLIGIKNGDVIDILFFLVVIIWF